MSKILKEGYGIMPNTILFDKTINAQEKLFFVFISSLCAEKGYCWANNNYFAEKMDLSTISVSRYINLLSKKGYIYIYIDKEKGNKRYIGLDETIIKNDDTYNQKGLDPIIKNDDTPIIKNDKHNNIIYNSINNNIKEEGSFFVPENFLKNLEEMNFLDGSYPNIDKKRLLNTYIPPIIDYYKSKKKEIKIPKNIFRSRISKETSYPKNKFIVNKIIDESQFY